MYEQYVFYIPDTFGYIIRMNDSKHTLAGLRRIIGLRQKELAGLIGCSLPTVQAIEYGKLKLSPSLAERISRASGIGIAWLLDNDLSKPPVDEIGMPYTRARFDECQAHLQRPLGGNAMDSFGVRFSILTGIATLAGCASAALKSKQFWLFAYKLAKAHEALVAEFGEDRSIQELGLLKSGTAASTKGFAQLAEKSVTLVLKRLYETIDANTRLPRAGGKRPRNAS